MVTKRRTKKKKSEPAPKILLMESEEGSKSSEMEETGGGAEQGSGEDLPTSIVGIGASAGGLEALEQFFSNMPNDTDLAFIVIQHQDPKYRGLLAEIIQRYTEMPVRVVTENVPVQKNTVYVKPSNADLTIVKGVLTLAEPQIMHGIRMPIDMFFRSLAEDQNGKAIGILLSGMGSDGTLGIRALKERTGMVMAQEPSSSRFEVMPQSAITTGFVDYIASPEELPRLLLRYVKHIPHLLETRKEPDEILENILAKIFVMIRARSGMEFSMYKRSTIRRRIERRMSLHQLTRMEDYVRYLQENPSEIDVLSKELLIGVTRFLRDPAAWQQLKEELLEVLKDKESGTILRGWVIGCSTGEEAYSLAIILRECIESLNKMGELQFQIFATDVDSELINYARHGEYPANIAADVSAEHLERYFIKEDGTYRLRSELRETVIFARQNVIMDPPFTHLDVISCRNLLIYLSPQLQTKLIPLFHYSLNPGGLLFLGSAESIGGFSDLFKTRDITWKIFERRDSLLPLITQIDIPAIATRRSSMERVPSLTRESNVAEIAHEWLLEQFVPPSVIVNERGDILYFQGKTGKFLQPPGGKASLSIYAMAREGLQYPLTNALRAATRENEEVTVENITVRTNGINQRIRLRIKPIQRAHGLIDLYTVVFEDQEELPLKPEREETVEPQEQDTRSREIEEELKHTKEQLQHIIEENQASQEEMKSMNEELQSTNEELQSTNEELTTSKEELQSLNEELLTVNAELQTKLDELSKSNDDMRNLLRSTEIPLLFLDNNLRVRKYTEPVKKFINLISSDVGRPISDLMINLKEKLLMTDIQEVLDSLVYKEKRVETTEGKVYTMRILPYRTLDNRIDGVIISFLDITGTAKLLEYAENIISTVREPLLVLDGNLRVISANKSFYTTFQVTQEETEQHLFYELGGNQWDIPKLRHLLEEILPRDTSFDDFKVEHDFTDIGHRVLSLNARKIQSGSGSELILLAIDDITEDENA